MRDIAFRREKEKKRKHQVEVLMNRMNWNPSTPESKQKHVGVQASTHFVRCSCPMCGNPRRHFSQKTLAELKFEESQKVC